MAKLAWQNIIASKLFHVSLYRKFISILCLSLCINILLLGLIAYWFFNWKQEVYYATNGIMAPIPLTALDAPNNSGEALLPPDPLLPEPKKVITE